MKALKIFSTFLWVTLASCGGGGGGGGSNTGTSTGNNASSVTGTSSSTNTSSAISISSSANTSSGTQEFNIDTNMLDFSIYAGFGEATIPPLTVTGTVKNPTGTVYVIVDISKTNLVRDVSIAQTSDSGQLTVYPVAPTNLPLGKSTGVIYVYACKDLNCTKQYTGSPKTITVNYNVKPTEFTLSNSSIDFKMIANHEFPPARGITLTSSYLIMEHGASFTNNGSDWLHLNDSVQLADTKGVLSLAVTKQLPPGTYISQLQYYVNSKFSTRKVDVTLTVAPEPFTVASEELSFILDGPTASLSSAKKTLTVSGTAVTDWSASADDNWISLSKITGNTAASTQVEVSLKPSALTLGAGLHKTKLHFKNLVGDTVDRTIYFYLNSDGYVAPQYKNFSLGLTYSTHIVDKSNARLYVTDTNYMLYVVNLLTGKVDKLIKLPVNGSAIALSPDTKNMFIGGMSEDYVNQVVRIDTSTTQILNYFSVDKTPFSMVATNEGKLVVSWASGQFTSIDTFDSLTGIKTGTIAQIYEKSQLQLHPNNKWVFAIDTALSPTSLHVFDISGTGIIYRPESAGLSGWMDLGRYIYFIHDGSHLLTSDGAVLKTDLTLAHESTKLPKYSSIDFLPAKNQLVTLGLDFSTFTFKVNYYDATSLLPINGATNIDADANAIFVSQDVVYLLKSNNGTITITK